MKNRVFNACSASRRTLLAAACVAFPLAICSASAWAQTQGASVQLKEVVVTANRMEQALQTAPIGASVILGSDILASGVLDANEAVRKLGGVYARSDLGGGREFSLDLRGYGEASAQNLVVVIDGVRVSENELASARLSAIAPDNIERIEIVRGGASVMWGEGASGGVIQVITKRGAARGLSGSLGLGLESFGGRDAQARIDVGTELVSFNIGMRNYLSQGWRDNSAHEQNTLSLGTALASGGFKARLGFDHEGQSARFAGPLSLAQFAANPRQTKSPDDNGNTSQDRLTASAQYSVGAWTAALDLASRERASTGNFVGSSYSATGKSSNTQVSPRLGYQGQLGPLALNAVLGYDRFNWSANYQNNFGGNEDAQQTNKAWYASADVLFPSQTRLTAGLRTERFVKSADDAGNFLAYRFQDRLNAWDLAINQTLASHWDIYARSAKSYRLPNVDENRYTVAQLRPTLARDTEAGVKYLQGITSAALRLFHQRSVDEIAYDPTAGLFGANVNQDNIRRNGFELEGRTALPAGFDIGGNLQSIKARYTNGANVGKNVPLVPSLTLTARLGYAPDAKQRIELAARHRSSAPLGGDTANACSEKVPASTLLDLRYSFNQAADGKGWKFAAGVDNLTDKKTFSNAFTSVFSTCAKAAVYPETGRAFKVNAKYVF